MIVTRRCSWCGQCLVWRVRWHCCYSGDVDCKPERSCDEADDRIKQVVDRFGGDLGDPIDRMWAEHLIATGQERVS